MANERNHVYGNRYMALEKALRGLKNSQVVSQKNKGILEKWMENLSISGAKNLRIAKMLMQGMFIAPHLPDDSN